MRLLRLSSALAVLSLSASCASSGGDSSQPESDTGASGDTLILDEVAPDTKTEPDSGPTPDTTVADSGSPDTSVADTAVADTAVADTTVVDTTVVDTAVVDTAVADTAVADTAVADSGADTATDVAIEVGDSGPKPALIAYYPFDEGTGTAILDASGNGNNGVHTGTYVTGKKGMALKFTGGTGYGAKVIGNAAFTWGAANADYTVEYWIQVVTKAVSDWQSPFHKSDATGINCCAGTTRTPAQFFNPGALTMISVMGTASDGNHYAGATPAFVIGAWTHFAAVHQGSVQLLYVNGSLVYTDSLGSPTVGGTGVLYLGGDTFYPRLDGLMDEVRVYGGALTPAQIADDMR